MAVVASAAAVVSVAAAAVAATMAAEVAVAIAFTPSDLMLFRLRYFDLSKL